MSAWLAVALGLAVGLPLGWWLRRRWSQRHLRRFSALMRCTGPQWLTPPEQLVDEARERGHLYRRLLRTKEP